ncbi:MAG: ATP-grasp domain-containing protein [Bdellovibrionales bacterium]|nr:ATP-grasp domain-containing protein [Bdellovibrionales bacterium]
MKKDLNIVLVGYRKEAIKQALDMFGNVQLVVDVNTKIPKSLNVSHVYYFSNDELDFSLIEPPDLCLPLSESSIVMASKIKHKYQCLGYDKELSLFSHEKIQLKQQALKKKINISQFQLVTESTTASELIKHLGLPLVLKQQNSSGSRGLNFCYNKIEVSKHLAPEKIAESFIEGKEFSAEVFVKNKSIIFVNFTNYYKHLKINILPHDFSKEVKTKIDAFLLKIIDSYNIDTALLHIEFFVSDNSLTLGEFAIRPPGGYLMNLIQLSYNFSPWKAYFKLFTENNISIPQQARTYSSAIILHPGAGEVDNIQGVEEVKKLSSFHSIKLKKSSGDKVSHRQGSGQDIGYIFLTNKNKEALFNDIKSLETNFIINLITEELEPK